MSLVLKEALTGCSTATKRAAAASGRVCLNRAKRVNVTVGVQTLEFLYAALLGAGIGVLYDVSMLIRSFLKKNRAVYALLDILFWVFAVVFLLAFVMTVSGGKMRWYILVGVFCGIFIYKCTISALFFSSIRIIIVVIARLLKICVWPINWFAEFLHGAARGAWHKIRARRNVYLQKKSAKQEQAKEE
ncbi:MAG: spore cortex biosynthesis protein YabQ [Clostridia bacterium]